MIQKAVKKRNIDDPSEIKDDLTYWLNKSPKERIAMVEYLRKKFHGSTARLQRTARVVQLQ